MARLPRLVVPHQVHHIVQCAQQGAPAFRDADDYQFFLTHLREAAQRFDVAVHAYGLTPDRVQLLATPRDDTGLARMMQWTGRHYVPWYNRKYSRSGTLWQGRFRATVVDAAQYLMLCCRFIEHYPVHLGLAAAPSAYPWSSYAHHIGARADGLISDHALYWALGNTPFDREAAYKALAEQDIGEAESDALGQAIVKGWALGSPQFKAALEKQGGRRVQPARRGRPRTVATAANSGPDTPIIGQEDVQTAASVRKI